MPIVPRSRRTVMVAGVVVLLVAAFVLGAIAGAPVRDRVLPSQASLPDQVANAIADRFEGPVDRAALERAGATAIAEAVGDRWTAYFTPAEWAALKRASEGQYTGIGVTIRSTDDALMISEVFPGSPAATAGLRAGDRILAVRGVRVATVGAVASREAILGKAGTVVELQVASPGEAPRRVSVTRGEVTVPMVRARMVTGPRGRPVAYIELDRFEKGSGDEVHDQAMRLIRAGATGVVLDLRGDPGGLLDEAVAVAGVFLEPGQRVVSTRGRTSPTREREADGDPIPARIPVAVLVDGSSASASEIVAGALKDHGRAVAVGQPTFGKSKVQVTEETSDGGAVRVTIAGYLTPKGTDIGKGGVVPDVRASDIAGTEADEALAAALAALARSGG